MDFLLDYLTALRLRWRLILGFAALGLVVGVLTGGGASRDRDEGPRRAYSATHSLTVVDTAGATSRGSRQGGGSTDPGLDTISIVVTQGDVPRRASDLLGAGDDPAALADQISVTSDTELGTLEITAVDPDADRAEAVADAFATALLDHLAAEIQASKDARVAALQSALTTLQDQIDTVSTAAGATPSLVQRTQLDAFVDQYRTTFDELQTLQTEATTPGYADLAAATAVPRAADTDSSFDTPGSRAGRGMIGLLAGLLVGGAVALGLDRLDTSIRTAEVCEAVLGMPVLVSVPPLARRFRRGPLPPPGLAPDFEEAMRLLRATIIVAGQRLLHRSAETDSRASRTGNGSTPTGAPLGTILVTSANPAEGKSTLVAGLARTMALAPRRVIALDLDLRRPALHRLLGGPDGPGVGQLLAGRPEGPSTLTDILVEVAPGLRLAPGGDATEPTQLLSAGAELIESARGSSDVVVVDAPPLLTVSEPSELLPAIDGVLAVVFAGRTSSADAAALKERLALLGARVLGAVLVGDRAGVRSRRAYHRYYAHAAAPIDDRPSVNGGTAVTEPATPPTEAGNG